MHKTRKHSTSFSQRGWAWLAWAAPAAAKLAEGVLGQDNQRKAVHEQMDAQREFAQMGVRWKVADAKAAGIHPLYALGANTQSFSPISVGGSPMASALGDMGQDIGRAVAANQSKQERDMELARQAFRQSEIDAMNRQEHGLRVEGMMLENEYRRMRNRDEALGLTGRNTPVFQQLNAPTQVGPGFPGGVASPEVEGASLGSRDIGAIKLKPVEINTRDPLRSNREAGSSPAFKSMEVAPGQYMDVPTFQTDAEIPQTLRELYAYFRKWVSDGFFNGAPKYINAPSPRAGRGYMATSPYRSRRSFGH